MKKILTLTLISSIIAFVACNQLSDQEATYKKVQELEEKVYGDSITNFNPQDVNNLIVAFTSYTQKFPEDSLCAGMLFKAGELSMNMNQASQALGYFSKIENNYKNSERYPYSIFLKAFIYDTQLKNLDRAKAYYQKFINNFPTHELADDAKASIDNLGKSLEEIIQSFEDNPK